MPLPTAFHAGAISDGSGPVYTEYDLGGIFACQCTIPSYPGSFGSATNSFPTKKAARANAAREAMNYLIDQGLTNPDGTLLSRKKVKLGTAVRVENKKLEVKKDATYAQRVNGKSPAPCAHDAGPTSLIVYFLLSPSDLTPSTLPQTSVPSSASPLLPTGSRPAPPPLQTFSAAPPTFSTSRASRTNTARCGISLGRRQPRRSARGGCGRC